MAEKFKRLLIVKDYFDAAHKLEDHEGKCKNLHGHRWKVEFTFEIIASLDSMNMSVDFKQIKERLKAILPDHAYLNDVYNTSNPTAEFIAEKLFEMWNLVETHALTRIMFSRIKLISVEARESPECSALYVITD